MSNTASPIGGTPGILPDTISEQSRTAATVTFNDVGGTILGYVKMDDAKPIHGFQDEHRATVIVDRDEDGKIVGLELLFDGDFVLVREVDA